MGESVALVVMFWLGWIELWNKEKFQTLPVELTHRHNSASMLTVQKRKKIP